MNDNLEAFDRHGGIHEDQYKTSKQSRRAARADIDSQLEDMREDELDYVKHCMGIGPEFEHDMLTQSLSDEFLTIDLANQLDDERYEEFWRDDFMDWPEGEYS